MDPYNPDLDWFLDREAVKETLMMSALMGVAFAGAVVSDLRALR